MRTLNLGILAHVDAGKTTLTERILYAAGVIDHVGSVDKGTTQTDTLALERERGITIKSTVASFAIGDLAVNLIDTPGHPDFIAEVERVLSVLDGAVLVVSGVEGVQPQTPLLFRALQRLRVPTLIFINKIDRTGADDRRALDAISRRLTSAVAPMGSARGLGTRQASFTAASSGDRTLTRQLTELLAEQDDAMLAAYVGDDVAVPHQRLRRLLAEQTRRSVAHPVFIGSAFTGAGVGELMAGIAEFLPASTADPDGLVSGRVFKIERTPTGGRVAYARILSGTLRVRELIRYERHGEDRVTAISAFTPEGVVRRSSVSAGEIAKLSGLADVQVGDVLGAGADERLEHHFPRPTLESVVIARDPAAGGRLRAALGELAEQDPLINVRQDDSNGDISVSLYGEVQKEVIGATLEREYGIAVDFHETTTICIERPIGTGEALEVLHAMTKTNITGKSSPYSMNPYRATLALRVDPAPAGSGVAVRLDDDLDVRLVPLYVYKTTQAFVAHMDEYIRDALQKGLHGWEVTDCTVTITDSGYGAPGTGAGDFRKLTPLVLRQALARAGTAVCEPMLHVRLEVPTEAVSAVLPLLARLRARIDTPATLPDLTVLEAVLPAARLHELQQHVPPLTGGEGVMESRFSGYEAVSGFMGRGR
jgi:ribosomal protection tetracycline resistance protein